MEQQENSKIIIQDRGCLHYIQYVICTMRAVLMFVPLQTILLLVVCLLTSEILIAKGAVVLFTLSTLLNIYLYYEILLWKYLSQSLNSYTSLDELLLTLFNKNNFDKSIESRINGTVKILKYIFSVNLMVVLLFLVCLCMV